MTDTDVIVIGAGAAGLTAAYRLGESGRSVLLLEAHNRVGGRILTSPDRVELGAEFIHGTPTSTFGLLEEAGIPAVETSGTAWVVEDGRIEPATWGLSDMHDVMRLAEQLPADISVEAFLDQVVKGDPRFLEAAESIRRRVRGFDAADPKRASIKAIVAEWKGDASAESEAWRPRGGYGALIEFVAGALNTERVTLETGSAVRAVRWKKGAVEVDVVREGRVEQRRARSIVVTVSLGVLCLPDDDPNAIRFDPPLTQKRAALDGVAMGPTLKVMLRFADRFWERIDDGCYADAHFFFAERELPFPTFWTSLPDRTPWLSAWVGGPAAAALSAESDDVIKAKAAESVQALFGDRIRVDDLLVESRVHNWQRDPFIRGSYSYTTVGGLLARRDLAAPVDGTLFFAGEATDDSAEATTVAGAIASGDRAAREVIGATR